MKINIYPSFVFESLLREDEKYFMLENLLIITSYISLYYVLLEFNFGFHQSGANNEIHSN